MSTKFKFLLAAPVKWPDRCAVCNKNPDEYNDLCGRVLRSKPWPDLSGLLTLRYPIKIVISVPLCRRHSFQMDCMQTLSFCSFVAMLLFAILSFAQFFDQEVQFPYFHAMVYFFISIVSFATYIFSIRRQPVRLKEVGDIFFTIVIKDKDYAKEFVSINDYLEIEQLRVVDKSKDISSLRYLKDISSLRYLVLVITIILFVLILILNFIFFLRD